MKERIEYDKWVTIHFQENALCDEAAIELWVQNCWKSRVNEESLLVLDIQAAQNTDKIKYLLKEFNITPMFMPPGCTSIMELRA